MKVMPLADQYHNHMNLEKREVAKIRAHLGTNDES